jgi:hypothetical protein
MRLTNSDRRHGIVSVIGVALSLLFAAGCGSVEEAGPAATGIVTLDGNPLAGGSIEFLPQGDGSSAFAPIQPDGTFQVATTAGKSGIAPGEYSVVIAPADVEDEEESPEGSTPAVPLKYTDETTTDLTVTIAAEGPNQLTLKLSSDAAPAEGAETSTEGEESSETAETTPDT